MKPSDISILVVDDDVALAKSIFELFQTFNFKVELAYSGDEAWAQLNRAEFHIVLSDMRMRNGNGLELAQKIRARHPQFPSILFTSGYSDVVMEEIYNEGVEGFFAKPFDGSAVREAIQRCLLDPVVRWTSPHRVKYPLSLTRRFDSVEKSKADGTLIFGRGGFFVSHRFSPPAKGTLASFSIESDDSKDLKFEGEGIVRWFQTNQIVGAPAGLGVEITAMSERDARIYQELFGRTRSFIPSPRKNLLRK